MFTVDSGSLKPESMLAGSTINRFALSSATPDNNARYSGDFPSRAFQFGLFRDGDCLNPPPLSKSLLASWEDATRMRLGA